MAAIDLVDQVYSLEKDLSDNIMGLPLGPKVRHMYDPVRYAAAPHLLYLRKFCSPTFAPLMLLGMNPGPWGMAQTGVPFGHVGIVRDWLGVSGPVHPPANQHSRRPVLGFSCTRSEVSGSRLWSLLQLLCEGDASALPGFLFLHNYCPLLMLDSAGANVTPADLKVAERRPLERLCDDSLRQLVTLVTVTDIVAVGNYAYEGACRATNELPIKVHKLMHPSPRNPQANKNWESLALQQLGQAGLLHHFSIGSQSQPASGSCS
ncbi:Uracil-DNA glycosylase-like [Trinorchestia longiramus]|nr:Uracil-DNA glycosylase-like [Trinorchestia longiramus]